MDNELVGKRAEGKVMHAARGRSDPPEVTVHCLYRSRSMVVGFQLSEWSMQQVYDCRGEFAFGLYGCVFRKVGRWT